MLEDIASILARPHARYSPLREYLPRMPVTASYFLKYRPRQRSAFQHHALSMLRRATSRMRAAGKSAPLPNTGAPASLHSASISNRHAKCVGVVHLPHTGLWDTFAPLMRARRPFRAAIRRRCARFGTASALASNLVLVLDQSGWAIIHLLLAPIPAACERAIHPSSNQKSVKTARITQRPADYVPHCAADRQSVRRGGSRVSILILKQQFEHPLRAGA